MQQRGCCNHLITIDVLLSILLVKVTIYSIDLDYLMFAFLVDKSDHGLAFQHRIE